MCDINNSYHIEQLFRMQPFAFFFLMLKFSDKHAKDFCFGEFDHQTIDFSFMTRPKQKTGPIYSSVGKGGH